MVVYYGYVSPFVFIPPPKLYFDVYAPILHVMGIETVWQMNSSE